MSQGGAMTLLPFFVQDYINIVMANAIKKASGVPSLEKYLEMAKTMFGETEPIPFVTNTKGDITQQTQVIYQVVLEISS